MNSKIFVTKNILLALFLSKPFCLWEISEFKSSSLSMIPLCNVYVQYSFSCGNLTRLHTAERCH
jgi:hypothetical protein